MKRKLVIIHWLDASGTGGWRPISAVDNEPCPIVTVGMVLLKDEKAITVAQSVDDKNDMADHTVTIPLEYIVRTKQLGWVLDSKVKNPLGDL